MEPCLKVLTIILLLSVLMASLMSWNWWRVLFVKACSSSLLPSVRWMSSTKRSLLIFHGLSPMNKMCLCRLLERGMSIHLTGGDQLSLLSHPWIYVEFRFFLLICDVCCAVRQHRRQSASLTDSLSRREAARPLFHEAEQNWRTESGWFTLSSFSLSHTHNVTFPPTNISLSTYLLSIHPFPLSLPLLSYFRFHIFEVIHFSLFFILFSMKCIYSLFYVNCWPPHLLSISLLTSTGCKCVVVVIIIIHEPHFVFVFDSPCRSTSEWSMYFITTLLDASCK